MTDYSSISFDSWLSFGPLESFQSLYLTILFSIRVLCFINLPPKPNIKISSKQLFSLMWIYKKGGQSETSPLR